MNKVKSLYIHIPFCAHICAYCDFTKLYYNKKFSEPYLRALFSEIDSYNIPKMETIYIGGGTPTALDDDEFETLLEKISPLLNENGEFTVEANVENLSEAKLKLMKRYGVNRISIGVESTSNKTLKEIDRHHTFEDARRVISLAKSFGFNNINVDLIYGYNDETIDDLKEDIKNLLSLDVPHISTYALSISKNTKMGAKNLKEQNEDDSRAFYDEILTSLRKAGYKRYEVSNFAREGFYSRHNMTYWKDEHYFGVGLGASGYIKDIRYTNTRNLDKYLKGEYIDFKEKITKELELEDYLLTNFRLEDGFSDTDFIKRFNKSFLKMFDKKASKIIKDGLIIKNNDKIMLSDDGIAIMDRILVELL